MGCVIGGQKVRHRVASASSWTKREGWVDDDGVMGDDRSLMKNEKRDDQGRVIFLNDRLVEVLSEEEEKFRRDFQQLQDHPVYDENNKPLEIENAIEIKAYLKEDKSNASLFVDTKQFPAEVKSLCKSRTYGEKLAWTRPHDLLSNAKIIHEFRNEIIDVLPGFVENSAFVLACSAIIQKEELIKLIFPTGQSLCGENYTGLINCRFWRFGTWIDVFIDDRLPCFNETSKTCRSSVVSEFWPALCEKAYAKLNGIYEALEYCRFVDILVDFTGFIVEAYDLHEPQKNLYKILCRALISGAVISSFLETDWDSEAMANNNSMSLNNKESKKSSSALHRRAYNIIDLKRVKRKTGNECLIKIRNPWSLGREWNGPWSDNDHRWSLVDDITKKWLQFIKKEDGEYWMSFRDFCYYFQQVIICTNAPYCDPLDEQDSFGKILSLNGYWRKSINSGGNRSDLYPYSTNPQYLLTVYEPDPIDSSYFNDDYTASETSSILISLMQEFRPKSPDSYVKLLNIGFAIYITVDPQNRLPVEFFLYNHDVASTAVYPNSRQITKRFELEAGYYVFIPATYAKDQEGEFLVRAFSSKRISIQKLPDHEGPPPQPVRQASQTSIVPPPVVHPAVVNNIEFQYDGGDWDPSTEISSRRTRPI